MSTHDYGDCGNDTTPKAVYVELGTSVPQVASATEVQPPKREVEVCNAVICQQIAMVP